MEKKDFEISNRHGKRIPASFSLSEKENKGTCIVLHGLGGWRGQNVILAAEAAALASGYHVVTYDSANGAEAPNADFFNSTTTGDYEDLCDVVAYIEQQEWYQAPLMLMGHSMGALVASEYVAQHPDAIEKLALLAPGISWRRFNAGLLFLLAGLWWGIGFSHFTPGPHERKLQLGRKWLFDLFSFDEYKNAKKIKIPTLVVAAGKDRTAATPKHLQQFAALFAQGTYAKISEAPHPFSGYHSELTGILTEWLTQS